MVWYDHLDQKTPRFLMWHFAFLTGLINLFPTDARIHTAHNKTTGGEKKGLR